MSATERLPAATTWHLRASAAKTVRVSEAKMIRSILEDGAMGKRRRAERRSDEKSYKQWRGGCEDLGADTLLRSRRREAEPK